MKEPVSLIFTILTTTTLLFSCNSGLQKGSEISKDDIEFIKGLGILDDNEKLILFNKQSDLRTSGNFFSDKRIAAYWIDKRNQSKTSIDFGLYPEIDTILTKDLSKSLTYSSYLEIVKHNGQSFKVYVDGDSSQVWTFFNTAMNEWSANKNNR